MENTDRIAKLITDIANSKGETLIVIHSSTSNDNTAYETMAGATGETDQLISTFDNILEKDEDLRNLFFSGATHYLSTRPKEAVEFKQNLRNVVNEILKTMN